MWAAYMDQPFGEDGSDVLKSVHPKYEGLIPQNGKTPRPFDASMIWPIFGPIFSPMSSISGRNSAGNRPKIFFSEKVHETDQKTYLHFFHISHSFFAILLFVFEYS